MREVGDRDSKIKLEEIAAGAELFNPHKPELDLKPFRDSENRTTNFELDLERGDPTKIPNEEMWMAWLPKPKLTDLSRINA